jgi:exopolysaccharide biosynthesis polyprenyl glycosylphosphotransferase
MTSSRLSLMPARALALPTWRPRVTNLRLDSPRSGLAVSVVDVCALTAAAVAGAVLWPPASSAMVVMYLSTLAAFVAKDAFQKRPFRPMVLDDLRAVIGSTAVGAMTALTIIRVAGTADVHYPFLRLWALYLVVPGAGRVVLARYEHYARSRRSRLRPLLIAGAGEVGARVRERLVEHPEYGFRPVGFVEDGDKAADAHLSGFLPRLGRLDELAEVARRTGAKHVVVAFSPTADRRLVEPIRRCEQMGIEVAVVPRMFESLSDRGRLEHVGGLPLLRMVRPDPRGFEFTIKHALDRVLAALLLLLLVPVMLAIVIAVRLSSSGDVLFRQRRIGRDGREFDLLKFRSMRPRSPQAFAPQAGNAPGGVEGEDRRTMVGRLLRRTSLDELPQLLNVLRGDMSLVGPRPERPEYAHQFEQALHRYRDRHRVKSGMTGWAQIHGLRGQTSIAKRVEWDNYYIENWSLWLDVKILASTVSALVTRVE